MDPLKDLLMDPSGNLSIWICFLRSSAAVSDGVVECPRSETHGETLDSIVWHRRSLSNLHFNVFVFESLQTTYVSQRCSETMSSKPFLQHDISREDIVAVQWRVWYWLSHQAPKGFTPMFPVIGRCALCVSCHAMWFAVKTTGNGERDWACHGNGYPREASGKHEKVIKNMTQFASVNLLPCPVPVTNPPFSTSRRIRGAVSSRAWAMCSRRCEW